MDKLGIDMGKNPTKQLAPPFNTGGGGEYFESYVQSAFVVLMLAGGPPPYFSKYKISKINIQAKRLGFETDDIVVFVENLSSKKSAKIVGQIKHSIKFTKRNKKFGEVIFSAWKDYNNSTIFDKKRDIVCLITGPLTQTDTNDVRTILEWSRSLESPEEFFETVNLAKFSSDQKRKKIDALRHHLTVANDGKELTDKEFFEFLQTFHILGYDLDIKSGVNVSMLETIIWRSTHQYQSSLWSEIVLFVQDKNKNSGTITVDSIDEEIRDCFKSPWVEDRIPDEFIIHERKEETSFKKHPLVSDLMYSCLIGSWDENKNGDKKIIEEFVGKSYSEWIKSIQTIYHESDNPFSMKNGRWRLPRRFEVFKDIAERYHDEHLAAFKKISITVLSERDPGLELPPEDRFAAAVHGKTPKYSGLIRKGLSEGLAMLGNNSEKCSNCSFNYALTIVSASISKIFADCTWVLWASLNDVIQVLAEAKPNLILDIVEKCLQEKSNLFESLFSQEGSPLFSRNYIVGLLWGLEILAWEEVNLVRVIYVLGELAKIDPGGNYGNRPINSMTTILLPWQPQTLASIDKRKVAVETLRKENPQIAWDLLISLLPNQTQSTMGSQLPSWRLEVPDNGKLKPTYQEFWDQNENYSSIVLSMALEDDAKLLELISLMENLAIDSYNELISYLQTEEVSKKSESKKMEIWEVLSNFISRHREFPEAKWSLDEDKINKIEEVAVRLEPKEPHRKYRSLFNDSNRSNRKGITLEEREKYIYQKRKEAIEEIFDFGGFKQVIKFGMSTDRPYLVGQFLGNLNDPEIESDLIPRTLSKDDNLIDITNGYIAKKFFDLGWEWVDSFDSQNWNDEEKAWFLLCLPFVSNTWARVKTWLKNREGKYWENSQANPADREEDYSIAVRKLIEFQRPNRALDCLNRMKNFGHSLDYELCVKALLSALKTDEHPYSMDRYNLTEIIKFVQSYPNSNPEDLFKIEWAYLPLLDGHWGLVPEYLETQLATDPMFYCEVIRTLFRSKNKNRDENINEQRKTLASFSWRLLRNWKVIPGVSNDGNVDEKFLMDWINSMKSSSSESGHLDVALSSFGRILVHSPSDPDGMWLNRVIAGILDEKDHLKMRNSFGTGILDLRGVHWVNPSGEPEFNLARENEEKAEELENAGFHRLALVLKDIASIYERDGKRIINEHEYDDLDNF